jgi:hypothetical protein
LVIDPSLVSPGNIYVGGTAGSNVVLTRLTYSGAVDTAFGTGGTASAPLLAGTVGLIDMRRAAGGQFVFGGTVTRPGTADDDFLVLRLNAAGALDATFGGGDGSVAIDMGTADDAARNLHITPSGRIIVAGARGSSDTLTEWAAARVFEQDVAPLSLAARRVLSSGGPRFELTINGVGVQGAENQDLIAVNLATGERINTFFVSSGGSSIPNTSARAWTLSQAMPNGLYKVVIPAGALSDSAGNPLGEYSFDFFVHNGSSGVDLVSVRRHDANNVHVSYNAGSAAAQFFTIPAPPVEFGTALMLGGGTGDDIFSVDYSSGELPAVAITTDGGGIPGTDTLHYIGQAGATFAIDSTGLIKRTGVTGPAASTYYGPYIETITVDTATYDFNGPTASKNLEVRGKAIANFNVTQRLGTLAISGQANVPQGGDKVILTKGLSITGNGYLELADNDLVINYDAGATSPLGAFNATTAAYDGVTGMIARAYNWGAWDQPGLRTSTERALVGQTTLAPAEAAAVLFLEPGQTALWNGVTVDDTTVLVKYTYTGDLNLDGLIDGADYGMIDNYVQFPGTGGYANGDFNFDGLIDGADYGLIDNAIQFQGDAL